MLTEIRVVSITHSMNENQSNIDTITPQSSENKPVKQNVNHDIGQGRGVYISTYGCQMKVNDTERMYSLLEMANFSVVAEPEAAAVIIINACSIREKPVHKVYSEVGRYRKLKDKNPHLKIGVGGCVGQQEKDVLVPVRAHRQFVGNRAEGDLRNGFLIVQAELVDK